MLRHKMHRCLTCQSGCSSDIYWNEWASDPPDCCDPCDDGGRWIGPQPCARRCWLRRGVTGVFAGLRGCLARVACHGGPCGGCGGDSCGCDGGNCGDACSAGCGTGCADGPVEYELGAADRRSYVLGPREAAALGQAGGRRPHQLVTKWQ
jgi:hypothetical protein